MRAGERAHPESPRRWSVSVAGADCPGLAGEWQSLPLKPPIQPQEGVVESFEAGGHKVVACTRSPLRGRVSAPTTSNGGSLGSWVDEDRSKMRVSM